MTDACDESGIDRPLSALEAGKPRARSDAHPGVLPHSSYCMRVWQYFSAHDGKVTYLVQTKCFGDFEPTILKGPLSAPRTSVYENDNVVHVKEQLGGNPIKEESRSSLMSV